VLAAPAFALRAAFTPTLVLCLALAAVIAPAPAWAQSCGFSGGFAALYAQLGPQVVGECLEPPQPADDGDVHQQTTGGLLVWTRATNLVAFTDGSRTWVSGPHSIQVRPNDQLFDWEEEALRSAEAISARDLALLYVETVRGNTDVQLEHIYAAARDLASARIAGWTGWLRDATARKASGVAEHIAHTLRAWVRAPVPWQE
jgi:hypothetical protein